MKTLKKRYLIIIVLLISIGIYFFTTPAVVRLRVALITEDDFLPSNKEIWKASSNPAKGYLDLLILNGIPYDIIWIDKEQSFSKLKFNPWYSSHSLIILALDGKKLPQRIINSIKKANKNGVKVISDITSLDDELLKYFKIRKSSEAFAVNKLEIIKEHKIYNFNSRFAREIKLEKGQAVFASFNGKPVIVTSKKGKAQNYILSFVGKDLFKEYDFFHRFLRDLIISAIDKGLIYFSFENKAILRMDDPGTSHRIWLKSGKYDSIDFDIFYSQWMEIIDILKKQGATLSIMYTPMFVDEGDSSMGELLYKGKNIIDRRCGTLYLSKDVIFAKKEPKIEFNFTKTYEALKYGWKEGAFDIQMHGYSHLTYKLNEWCKAEDKLYNVLWLSEYYDAIHKEIVPADEQRKRLESSFFSIEKLFGKRPIIFSPPAHFYTEETLKEAKSLGIPFIHSLVFYRITPERIIEMDEIKSVWAHISKGVRVNLIKMGYPIVLGFHDWDFKKHPIKWLDVYLNNWRRGGINRFISFNEFASYLSLSVDANRKRNCIEGELQINKGKNNSQKDYYFYAHSFGLMVKLPEGNKIRKSQCGDEKEFFKLLESGSYWVKCSAMANKQRINFRIDLVSE